MSATHELVRSFYEEVMSKGNLSFIDEYFAPDYVDHDDDVSGPGREGLKEHVAVIRKGFPDLRVTVEDILLDGDRVAVRTRAIGTHSGHFAGLAPTNRHVEIGGMDFIRFVDGRFAEHWGMIDEMRMMQQLGGIPVHA